MKFEHKGKWIKQINESTQKNESQIFIVEFNYDDDYAQGFGRGQCQVKANSEKEAIEKAKNYYAKKGRVGLFDFRVNKHGTKYSNDVVIESTQKNEGLDKKHIDYLNGRLEHAYDLDRVASEMLGPVRDYMVKHNIKVADYLPYMPDETKRRITYACRRQNRVPSNKYMKDDIFAGFWHSDKEKALLESIQKNENSLSVSAMLDFSLSEENDAVANYEKRAAKCLEHGNTKLADLFKELARDEKVHVAQLTKAKELLGLADNEIEQEGSDEAKEILINKGEQL